MIQKQIQLLLNKPMDRGEFLVCIGRGFLLVVGVPAFASGLIKLVNQPSKSTAFSPIQQNLLATHGFGASKFGT